MAAGGPREVPGIFDVVATAGGLLTFAGLLVISVRMVVLAWHRWGWWAGLAYAAAGALLVLGAGVGAWLYAVGIPLLRQRGDARE